MDKRKHFKSRKLLTMKNVYIILAIFLVSCSKETIVQQPDITGSWQLIATFDGVNTEPKTDNSGISLTSGVMNDCWFMDQSSPRTYDYTHDGNKLNIQKGKYVWDIEQRNDSLLLIWPENGFTNIFTKGINQCS